MNRHHKGDCVSRAAVFVDVPNMFYAARSFRLKIDYAKLIKLLSFNKDIACAIAYLAYKPEIDSTAFENMLKFVGFDIKSKEFTKKSSGDGNMKPIAPSFDVLISLDMLDWSEKVDTIILVSGNGAFVDTFRHMRGVRLEVAGFSSVTSSELKKAAHDFIELNDNKMDAEDKPLIATEFKKYSNKLEGLPMDEEVLEH